MKRLERALIRLEVHLRQLDIPWALVGGLAVSARSIPRTTQDIDLTISVRDDGDAEERCRQLLGRGYRVNAQLEHRDRNRLATVRFLALREDERDVVIDLLFASSGIETEVVALADLLEVLPGLFVPVARIGHLFALKTLAGRAQDVTDVERLLPFATPADLQLAREALALISRRGYDRGKSLAAEFEALIAGT